MRLTIALTAAALAACVPVQPPPAPPPAPIAAAPEPPPPPPPPAEPDLCGAASLEHLIGQHRSRIPVPVHPQARRVTCTTCPVTMDYSPYRVNILFDAQTEIIKEVKCG